MNRTVFILGLIDFFLQVGEIVQVVEYEDPEEQVRQNICLYLEKI